MLKNKSVDYFSWFPKAGFIFLTLCGQKHLIKTPVLSVTDATLLSLYVCIFTSIL